MRKCPVCESELTSRTAKFCRECGAKIAPPPAHSSRRAEDAARRKKSRLFFALVMGVIGLLIVVALIALSRGNHGRFTEVVEGTKTVELGGGVSLELVGIPPGEFVMGSPSSEAHRYDNEGPQHRVQITQGFWMGKYEVTQAQWQSVMGNNPRWFTGDGKLPVEQVSWDDCQEFVKKLSQRVGGTFRLPTEAEWEYACRAGSSTAYCFGDDESRLGDYAWYDENSGNETHPVGQKKPNAWGLYDMHGNVYEWCGDWFGDYPSGAVTDPTGPSSGSRRVVRGGGWNGGPWICRSADRIRSSPVYRYDLHGFRVALPAVQSRP